MEMDILFFIANQRKLLANELKEFINNYVGRNPLAIIALANKIEHMCFNIGCPSSVEPMLKSIVTGKIKTWSNDSDDRGKQLTGYHISYITNTYQDKKTGVIDVVKGHFRWDYRAYTFDRKDLDYIKDFFIDKKQIEPVNPEFEIQYAVVSYKVRGQIYPFGFRDKTAVTKYGIKIETFKGNDYYFEYDTITKRISGDLPKKGAKMGARLFDIVNEAIRTNNIQW